MNVALVIPNGQSYIAHFIEVKAEVILMKVRGDPAHPNITGLLPSKDAH